MQKTGYTGFRDSGFYPVNVFAAAYAIDKYLNKNDTPEETLRRAIVKGEIVPFYQPIVNGREGRYAVLKFWPDGNIQKPGIFLLLPLYL